MLRPMNPDSITRELNVTTPESNNYVMILLTATQKTIETFLEENEILFRGHCYVHSLFEPFYYHLPFVFNGPMVSSQWLDSYDGLRRCALFFKAPYYQDKHPLPLWMNPDSDRDLKSMDDMRKLLKSIVHACYQELSKCESRFLGGQKHATEVITLPVRGSTTLPLHLRLEALLSPPMTNVQTLPDLEGHLKKLNVPKSVLRYIDTLREYD